MVKFFGPILLLLILLAPVSVFSQDESFGMIRPGPAVLFGTGILFMETSTLLVRPGLLVNQNAALSNYREYLTDTSGYGPYTDVNYSNKLQRQGWLNFGAGALFASSVFFFPEEHVTISFFGKMGLITGLAAVFAGNFFDFLALGAYAESKYHAYHYENATTGVTALYELYEEQYRLHFTSNLLGMILKGAGGAIVATSFLLPGKKKPFLPGTIHKILNASALVLFTAGTVTKSMAQVQVVQLPYAFFDYKESSTNSGQLFEVYQELNTAYTALTLTSYGLWIAGGSALITSLFLPAPSEAEVRAAERASENEGQADELSLSFMPVYNGNIGIGFHVTK